MKEIKQFLILKELVLFHTRTKQIKQTQIVLNKNIIHAAIYMHLLSKAVKTIKY